MENVIKLPARYGMTHKLVHDKDDLWHIEFDKKSVGTYSIIGFEEADNNGRIYTHVHSLDPEGGPFLSVGDTIEGYTIKSITSSGLFKLVKE